MIRTGEMRDVMCRHTNVFCADKVTRGGGGFVGLDVIERSF